MTFKTYEINVDLVHDTSTTCSNRFSQNDRNSAKLLVTITNKGAELDLSQAKSVRMSFKKPDGTRVFQNDCQPINAMKGKYQIVLKTQTLTSVGNVIAQIHIEEEDRIIDTQKFFFVVNDSLSSDEAIESTNEFTIIQKAIEAGKKLEGVDINGIIAAGELAKGALPKTGGTMTGPLDIDNNIIMRLKGETGKRDWLVFRDSAHDSVVMAPRLADNSDWDWSKQIEFRPDNFIVNGQTNLVKKTGSTMEGWLRFLTNQELQFHTREGKSIVAQAIDGEGNYFAWNSPASRYLWFVNGKTGETIVQADNLLSKNGGAMAGTVTYTNAFSSVYKSDSGKRAWVLHHPDSDSLLFAPETTPDSGVWDWAKGIEFKGDGTIKMAKDGRANLVLTADATAINPIGYPNVATRRGNTVTVNLAVTRNVGSTGNIVATLPVDMRPIDNFYRYVLSEDGTPVYMMIQPDGGIRIDASGKNMYISETYVVD
ncbi:MULTISPECIES: BppU family phage baseplate upper protein [Bacillus cereus group]|uniref:BppU family phage baseplate upper protein n=3 Tax=Bacillus paranthracis TaxID=2026186 RepID=A0ABT6E4L9_9BACI|nr:MULTISPECIES: BppU family phage baseplate upper protein [Bacillus cereus group]MDA1985921.1 BppU family phage baseplate upper protein [Bacillus cereus group sp. Bcc13]MDG0918385.1 BppU family phage baseplate upper protein [Bacillus paranthracis]MDG0937464.1 BppU family phage baseplate upper protein [Bacillus paranthracis]MDG0944560.1 BppU family phage baseplate upper protein [Bacillus paranthracis]MDG0956750.1 BppU family phage baseplate upper protein [Bacillus paranthracis]